MKLRGNKYLKNLDKYLGVPLLFCLGLFKIKKVLPQKVNKVGLLLAPAIGDIILTSSLLKEIKKNNPGLQIFLFVPEGYIEVAQLIGNYDIIIDIKLSDPIKTIGKIRREHFDIFIDTSQWARLPALIAFFAKSKFTIGFYTKGQGKHFCFDKAVPHSNKVHEIVNLNSLNFLDINHEKYFADLILEKLVPVDSQKVIIHLKPSGYLSYRKEWPLENWEYVVSYLLNKGMKIKFTGSKSDRLDIDDFIKKFGRNDKLFNLAGSLSLLDTAYELKSSKIVICVNTGIMHLASFLNCNLIALHGPTNPDRWGPLNKNAIIIKTPYPEAPCLDLGFEYNCNDTKCKCMQAIVPDVVIEAIDKFLTN